MRARFERKVWVCHTLNLLSRKLNKTNCQIPWSTLWLIYRCIISLLTGWKLEISKVVVVVPNSTHHATAQPTRYKDCDDNSSIWWRKQTPYSVNTTSDTIVAVRAFKYLYCSVIFANKEVDNILYDSDHYDSFSDKIGLDSGFVYFISVKLEQQGLLLVI